uniref:HTH_Tnp_IS630 domain-containing protein n=1 Tax=Globodera pallida TaxID=36090 RepID=A0A183CC51_GLOPA
MWNLMPNSKNYVKSSNKWRVEMQRTRSARSLSEHADACNVKVQTCKERLGLWLELGRNFTVGASGCNAAIRFAGRFLLKKAGLDFDHLP